MTDDAIEGERPQRTVGSVTDVYRSVSAAPSYVRSEDTEDGDEKKSLGVLSGHFSRFNDAYRIDDWWEGSFMERVAPGAFKDTFKRNGTNIKVMFEHGYDPQIGKKTLGKLRKIEEDKEGGYYEAELYNTSYNRDLEEPLRAGDYGASFRFRILRQEIDEDPERTSWNPDGLPVRTILEADVMEVGPVVWGANPNATASVRSATDYYRPPNLAREGLQHNEVREAKTEIAKEIPQEAESAVEATDDEVRHEETETAPVAAEVTETESVEETRNEETETTSNEETRSDETSNTTDDVKPVSTTQKGESTKMATPTERQAELDKIEARFAEIDAEYPTAEYTDEVQTEVDALRASEAEHTAALERHKANQEALAARSKAREEARSTVQTNETRSTEGGAKVTDPEVYRKTVDGKADSYFKDLYRATQTSDYSAAERLRRNDKMVHAEQVRAGMTTVDGAGGEFVPPLWMVNQFLELSRAGRVTADQLSKEALPAGTDTILLPKIATGSSVAAQATQNTALSETDITTGSVSASVETVGGLQTVSLQLLEQSPVNIDSVVFPDLVAQYAAGLDQFVLSNNAAGKRGLRFVSGVHAVTYTDAAPTAQGLYPKVADAIQRIHTQRYASPTRIVMHPRRWAFMLTAMDEAGRPLVVPAANAPQNVIATVGGLTAEGFVGSMQGLPVFVDANIPTNLGAGTNEDVVIVLKADDVKLYEGALRTETSRENQFKNASVVFRLYNYAMIHSERQPKSIAIISGTGLVTPTF